MARNLTHGTRPLHPVLKILLIAVSVVVGLALALFLSLWLYFDVGVTLASYKLPGGHTLRVIHDRDFDIGDPVRCQLDGLKVRHRQTYVAVIFSDDLAPTFTLHGNANAQVYWVTADSQPDSILYIVDMQERVFWPGHQSWRKDDENWSRLLAFANDGGTRYHLGHSGGIGVKK